MPVLTNSKHERFAQELARGVSQQQAYVSAGYKAHISNPSALAKSERIQARIAELHSDRIAIDAKATAKAVESLAIDKAWVLSRLVRNAERSLETEDGSVANRALELIGKELGMFIDRKHIELDGEIRELSNAQLLSLLTIGGEDGDSAEGGRTVAH